MTLTDQPYLFLLEGETSSGALELFPAVWRALEGLASPQVITRDRSLDNLLEMNAPRLSPLVTYVIFSRLQDPDGRFRARVIAALAEILSPDEQGRPAPEEVRKILLHHLVLMRTRTIYAILQVALEQPERDKDIAILLNACPYASDTLTEILADRKADIALRKTAAHYIGQVGFLDAITELERVKNRLETRQAGQRNMPFLPPSLADETELLPEVAKALQLLQSV